MLESNGRGKRTKKNLHMKLYELGTLCEYVKANSSMRYYVLVVTQFMLGLRATEVTAIHILDFLHNYSKLEYRDAKTREKLTVPVPEELGKLIKDYVKLCGVQLQEGWLFPNLEHPEKKHLDSNNYGAQFAKWREEIGLEHPDFNQRYVEPKLKWLMINAIIGGCVDPVRLRRRFGVCERDVEINLANLRKEGKLEGWAVTIKGLEYSEKEDLVTTHRIGTHSLRRLHRDTFLRKGYDMGIPPQVVKELCHYADWKSFECYINTFKMREDETNIVNQIFNPVIVEAMTGNQCQRPLVSFAEVESVKHHA